MFAAPRSGVVASVDPRVIGFGVIELGGGRVRANDAIDPSVGFVIGVRAGDYVREGEPVATVFAKDAAGVEAGRRALRAAIRIGPEAEFPLPLISHRIGVEGATPYEAVDGPSVEASPL